MGQGHTKARGAGEGWTQWARYPAPGPSARVGPVQGGCLFRAAAGVWLGERTRRRRFQAPIWAGK